MVSILEVINRSSRQLESLLSTHGVSFLLDVYIHHCFGLLKRRGKSYFTKRTCVAICVLYVAT